MEKGKDCAQAMWLTLKSLFQFQGQIKRERVGEGGGGVCGVCVLWSKLLYQTCVFSFYCLFQTKVLTSTVLLDYFVT